MIRTPGWEGRLAAEIAASQYLPFAWHDNDCCAFAARCVLAVTGEDLFAVFRGSYRHSRDAMRLLRMHRGLATLCDVLVGDRRPALTAQRGDLILLSDSTIAVCGGSFGFAPGSGGLVTHSQGDWRAAWAVG